MGTRGEQTHTLSPDRSPSLRRCFRVPVPEIALAARLLEDAVTAHLLGHPSKAAQLIRMADMPEIREWTESIWGKSSLYVQSRQAQTEYLVSHPAQPADRRMPSKAEKDQLLKRDGYHCRFCAIPLIRSEVRALLHALYPADLPWGATNITQHAAFQAMWVQYDHVVPYARGGDSQLDNFVIACAACNYGRMEKTFAEVGLEDPRSHEPFKSSWDGLERLRSTRPATEIIEVREGLVDRKRDHFEVRYGPSDQSWNDWLPVAIVGLANSGWANVQFLLNRNDTRNFQTIKRVWEQINFYLVELKEESPWLYLQHHCTTSANIYSDVHWDYLRPELEPN